MPAKQWTAIQQQSGKRSFKSRTATILDIDFLKRREFGGFTIDWYFYRPAAYSISTSADGKDWTTRLRSRSKFSPRDYVYLPESDARCVRLSMTPAKDTLLMQGVAQVDNRGFGISEITVQPLAWSATMNDFFYAVASDARPASYPRYYSRKQIVLDGHRSQRRHARRADRRTGLDRIGQRPVLDRAIPLLDRTSSSRGTTRSDRPVALGSTSRFPRSRGDRLASNMTRHELRCRGGWTRRLLYARYRIRNHDVRAAAVDALLAIRPFQVNPPWQFLNTQGGAASDR